MDVLTSLCLIVWFIYGNHLIWRYRLPRFEQTTEDPENWCAKNVYLLTIISVAYTYAFVTLMILIVVIVVLTVHFHNRRLAIREAKEAGCTWIEKEILCQITVVNSLNWSWWEANWERIERNTRQSISNSSNWDESQLDEWHVWSWWMYSIWKDASLWWWLVK